MNLLTNAIQAVGSEGTITITLEDVGDQPARSRSATRGRAFPGKTWPEYSNRFSARNLPGQGTGLGLFVSRGIVEKLGGTITVASKIGQGASFSIRLPKQLKKTDDYNASRGENWVERIKSRFTE